MKGGSQRNVQRASPPKRFHGFSWKISPDTYRRNSGLCFVGSSHGVSIEVLMRCEQRAKKDVTVLPARRVNKITPIPQTSIGSAEYGASPFNSGATYGRLPHRSVSIRVLPDSFSLNTEESPKSDIFRAPATSKSRFSGLRSRWQTPWLWMYSFQPVA